MNAQRYNKRLFAIFDKAEELRRVRITESRDAGRRVRVCAVQVFYNNVTEKWYKWQIKDGTGNSIDAPGSYDSEAAALREGRAYKCAQGW